MFTEDYILRYSKKAKYLQVQVTRRGVEVVVPIKKKLSHNVIQEFLQKKQAWIDRSKKKIFFTESNYQTPSLPSHIYLRPLNQRWSVRYLSMSHKKINFHANLNHEITLLGPIQNETNCFDQLRRWLKQFAKAYLTEQLNLLSNETGLRFQNLSIRNNLTRWGSCSAKADINLCCKLMFLPYSLMRYVLLHELCHTKYMNHGKRFWKLLTYYDPSAKIHSKELARANEWVPAWVQERRGSSI